MYIPVCVTSELLPSNVSLVIILPSWRAKRAPNWWVSGENIAHARLYKYVIVCCLPKCRFYWLPSGIWKMGVRENGLGEVAWEKCTSDLWHLPSQLWREIAPSVTRPCSGGGLGLGLNVTSETELINNKHCVRVQAVFLDEVLPLLRQTSSHLNACIRLTNHIIVHVLTSCIDTWSKC